MQCNDDISVGIMSAIDINLTTNWSGLFPQGPHSCTQDGFGGCAIAENKQRCHPR